jgi:hypothetical protein
MDIRVFGLPLQLCLYARGAKFFLEVSYSTGVLYRYPYRHIQAVYNV